MNAACAGAAAVAATAGVDDAATTGVAAGVADEVGADGRT